MNPNVVLPFSGGFVRPMALSDVHDVYVHGLNDPEVNHYLDAVKSQRQTYGTVKDFVRSHVASESSVLWGIWQDGGDSTCGTVRLHGIENRHRTALIGVCLFDKSVWGKGLASKALRVVTTWAMDELGLRWVEAGIFKENIASQRAFIAAGYSLLYDIPGKYLLVGRPSMVSIYVAQNVSR